MANVFVALRKQGSGSTIGYFPTAEIPEGWTLASEPQRDISDVMASLRCSKEHALRVMNVHWQQ